jgi:hypothetical protein
MRQIDKPFVAENLLDFQKRRLAASPRGSQRTKSCEAYNRDLCDPHVALLNDRSTRIEQLRIRPTLFRLVHFEVVCRVPRRMLSTGTCEASTRGKSRNPMGLFATIR